MTALTSDAQRVEKEGKLQSMQVKGSTVIYKNALVAIDANGFIVPLSDTAGLVFVGMAYERVDASNASDGELSVRVELRNAIEVAGAGFVQADMMKEVFGSDDNTVALSTTNSISVGRILEVISATKVLVQPSVNNK